MVEEPFLLNKGPVPGIGADDALGNTAILFSCLYDLQVTMSQGRIGTFKDIFRKAIIKLADVVVETETICRTPPLVEFAFRALFPFPVRINIFQVKLSYSVAELK